MVPALILGQEFYPGFLSSVTDPICYSTSSELSFEALPSGGSNSAYSYQWQISWNQSNWFDIINATSTTHTTDILYEDVYYRVLVTYEDVTLTTNTIPVWVLPQLDSGVLLKPGAFCDTDEVVLELDPDGAEWWWGGFLGFSYQWQQNTVQGPIFQSMWDSQKTDGKGWFDVGEDLASYSSYLLAGFYYFRCIVTSPYGCGTVYTNTIMVDVQDCSSGRIGKVVEAEKSTLVKFNILGALSNQESLTITIYNNGQISKTKKNSDHN